MAKVHLEKVNFKMYNCSFDVGEPSNQELQVLPLRRQVNPYLPTVTILGIMEAEAGSRA